MRPTPASRPTARPVRRSRPSLRAPAARFAGAAVLAGSLTAGPAFAQAPAPQSGQMRQVRYEVGAELPRAAPAPPRTKSKPKRGFFAKLFKIPSKSAAAGRAPGGPPPPPPAPHLKYARRATPAAAPTPPPAPAPIPTDYAPPVAAARSATPEVRAVRPSPNGPVPVRPAPARTVAARPAPPAAGAVRPAPARPVPPAGVIDEGVAPPPSPRRYEAPRVAAAPARVAPAPTAPAVRPGRPVPRETAPRSVPFASTAAPVAAAPPGPSGRAGRVSLKSPAPPPARRVAVPPVPAAAPPVAVAEAPVRAPAPAVLVAEDAEFFPELSEAAADRLPRTAAAPVPPAAEIEETPVLNPLSVPDAPARVAAAAPIETVEEPGDESPFTGLSLAAPEPATVAEKDEPTRTAEAELTLDATDDEEAGWDLALAAADPVERESKAEEPAAGEPAADEPTLSLAAPSPAAPATPAETAEEPKIAPRSTVPARLANAPKTERIPARTAGRSVKTPGRPDPTKLLAKLAARADRSLMMGFCPVTLRDDRDLIEGDERFTADFEGVTYRFASAAARDAFKADPIRYAPMASGRDLVIASTGWGETVGSLAHAAWYRGRLYLFASRESMRRFVDSPRDYLGG